MDNPPIYFIGHTPKILVDNPPIETVLYKAMSCTHTRLTRCPRACAMLILLHGIYVFHACFSTHTISMLMYSDTHTNILFTETVCYLKPRKSTRNLDFFLVFLSHKNNMHIPTLSSQNCMLLNQEIIMQTGFFSRFPAQKNNMHILTLSSQKLHVTQPRVIMQIRIFFPDFQLKKTACIY